MPVKIRAANAEDIPALVPLITQLGYTLSVQKIADNLAAIRQRGGEVFVADQQGVCGSVTAILDARLAEGVMGEIVSLVVDERTRGSGVGGQLIAEAERFLSQNILVQGGDKVRVRVNLKRSEALQFYQAKGYRRIKSQSILIKQISREENND